MHWSNLMSDWSLPVPSYSKRMLPWRSGPQKVRPSWCVGPKQSNWLFRSSTSATAPSCGSSPPARRCSGAPRSARARSTSGESAIAALCAGVRCHASRAARTSGGSLHSFTSFRRQPTSPLAAAMCARLRFSASATLSRPGGTPPSRTSTRRKLACPAATATWAGVLPATSCTVSSSGPNLPMARIARSDGTSPFLATRCKAV
mmetsp:Transcript_14812/g.43225  ORF Transcript_14812/g.43225 Transcript_14812/m.43225 type:complete len:203 (+) Transcript_14812:1679-2287(+)